MSVGRLEEALEQYRTSKKFGITRADMHIRNVRSPITHVTDSSIVTGHPQVSAKLLGRMMEEQSKEKP